MAETARGTLDCVSAPSDVSRLWRAASQSHAKSGSSLSHPATNPLKSEADPLLHRTVPSQRRISLSSVTSAFEAITADPEHGLSPVMTLSQSYPPYRQFGGGGDSFSILPPILGSMSQVNPFASPWFPLEACARKSGPPPSAPDSSDVLQVNLNVPFKDCLEQLKHMMERSRRVSGDNRDAGSSSHCCMDSCPGEGDRAGAERDSIEDTCSLPLNLSKGSLASDSAEEACRTTEGADEAATESRRPSSSDDVRCRDDGLSPELSQDEREDEMEGAECSRLRPRLHTEDVTALSLSSEWKLPSSPSSSTSAATSLPSRRLPDGDSAGRGVCVVSCVPGGLQAYPGFPTPQSHSLHPHAPVYPYPTLPYVVTSPTPLQVAPSALTPSSPGGQTRVVGGPGVGFYPAGLMLGMGSVGAARRASLDKPPAVKKYKCDICDKAFSRSNTLVTHKRIHTGDKPFKCDQCGRAFRQPGNLTRHRLTHTTHKPYICVHCGKAFNRASNLNTHMRTHNVSRTLSCQMCRKHFTNKHEYRMHMYSHGSSIDQSASFSSLLR